jgi:crotonobetainyl-CoA:carnitine CoA-transferase CaiB-like acyl-CoA transferase
MVPETQAQNHWFWAFIIAIQHLDTTELQRIFTVAPESQPMASAGFQPLVGIRVVEMTHMIMGPSCGMFLGQLGAEVIKVEPPAGDKTRYLTGMGSPFFPLFNRGKKSVQLDTALEPGRHALDKLLATADVFVDNFRDESLAKMGADPVDLRRRFPRLILASHKGFLSGPYQERTAMDEVVQMMTGLAYMTGPTGRPLRVGSSANDIMGGLFGALAVVCALMERDKTGRGRDLRMGLFENCLLLVAADAGTDVLLASLRHLHDS